ncbi:hypothetical protein HanHA300_Chr16g0604131 [Helianthus annuus]|nr:hypothetical protein HanHA300_Chr16g0604131 [Helianthus annuus]KAJ0459937.1 hypothetical protein HanHA89_Chr16g0654771 [Helianthus annuus]
MIVSHIWDLKLMFGKEKGFGYSVSQKEGLDVVDHLLATCTLCVSAEQPKVSSHSQGMGFPGWEWD